MAYPHFRPAIRDFLHRITGDYLLIEYVDPADEMFQSLLAARENIYDWLTLEQFLESFTQRFELLRQEPIPDSKRTLLLLRKDATAT